jgi:hypothetical protein
MKAGKYCFQELFINRYVEKLVIPEIQRDYVWKKTQVEGLLNSISKDFDRFEWASIPQIKTAESTHSEEQLKQDFEEFYRQRNFSSNIGFIYAYSDSQYEGRYFLIDGQQRITTVYLTLLLIASRTARGSDFSKQYCINGEPKLDYRVRDNAHRFLNQLIPFVLDQNIDNIKEQNWYLQAYDNDVTITHIVNNLSFINDWLEQMGSSRESKFYDYLSNYTECWYFDTNISAQGENLYIYLNARGEQMQGNENLKADLLSRLDKTGDKNQWGKAWEEWQDYFWRKRGKGLPGKRTNDNADPGFNEFLRCITGLNIYLDGSSENWLNGELSIDITPPVLSEVLNLELIQSYITTLEYLDILGETIDNTYGDSSWYKKCIHAIWKLFNGQVTTWIADYSHPNLAVAHRNMVFLWGILHWVNSAISTTPRIDDVQVIRGIRQFYLRFNNNIRSVPKLKSGIDSLLAKDFISDDEKSEEYKREFWLKVINSRADKFQLEAVIWSIEDHPNNLNGSDVGLTNISHLFEFDPQVTLEYLSSLKEAFYKCFPTLGSNRFPISVIQSLLLHYGNFWRLHSPFYYENYCFNEWRRIIRQSAENEKPSPFRQLLSELMADPQCSPKSILEEKRLALPDEDANEFRKQLLWYNYHLKECMWDRGAYIALCNHQADHKMDKVFNDKMVFINTKGNFKGSSHRVLSDALPNEAINKIVIESSITQ